MNTATKMTDEAEAVIISGRRRGQIVRIPASPFSDWDWAKLNRQLDKLNKKLAAVSAEVRQTVKSIKI